MPFDGEGFVIPRQPQRTENEDIYLAILKEARKGIAQKRKWCKGMLESYHTNPARCALGWINIASCVIQRRLNLQDNFADGVTDHVIGCLPITLKCRTIPGYNDRSRTRHKDIVALFDMAITDLENR